MCKSNKKDQWNKSSEKHNDNSEQDGNLFFNPCGKTIVLIKLD